MLNARRLLSLAWANLVGRRTATATLVAVIAAQSIVVLSLLILLRDQQGNVLSYYDRGEWKSRYLVPGDLQASGPLTPAQLEQLKATPGVLRVVPEYQVNATTGDAGGSLLVRSWVPDLDVRLVDGRAPSPGSGCEAAVTSDVDGATVGKTLDVQVIDDKGDAGARPLTLTVTGIVDRGFPLLGGAATALVGCDLPSALAASVPALPVADAVVTTRPGTSLGGFLATSFQVTADDQIRGGHRSAGMLVLLAVVLSCLGLITTAVVSRGGTRTRGHEMSVRRALGHTRTSVLVTTWIEAAIVVLAGVLAAVPVAVVLAKVLLRTSSWLDPASPWRFAFPSLTSVGLVLGACLVVVLAATGVAALSFLRRDPAVTLRKRQE